MRQKLLTLCAFLCLSSWLGAQQSSSTEHQYQLRATTGEISINTASQSLGRHWAASAVLSIEKNGAAAPIVHVFDAQGIDSPAVLHINGADIVNVESASHAADGVVGVVGSAHSADGRGAGFIALISADRQSTDVIRMAGHFLPQGIAFSSDGTIWTKGWEATDVDGRHINDDAPILRHFDRSGRLINALLSRRTLPSLPRYILTDGYGFLVASKVGVGWKQKTGPYYEIAANGKDVTEYPGVPMRDRGEFLTGLALTDEGDVFASTSVYAGADVRHGLYLYKLDRKVRTWSLVDVPINHESDPSILLGTEGNALAFGVKQPGLIRFYTVE